MQVYLVSGQIVNLLWQIFNAIGQIFMVVPNVEIIILPSVATNGLKHFLLPRVERLYDEKSDEKSLMG